MTGEWLFQIVPRLIQIALLSQPLQADFPHQEWKFDEPEDEEFNRTRGNATCSASN
jgi:hypothetical protein